MIGAALEASASERHLLNVSQCGGKKALIRIGPGHSEEDSPDTPDYSGSNFEQFELESIGCGDSQLGPCKALPQVPKQNEGESMQQKPKLVCLEPGTAQAVSFKMNLEFLYPVFGIAATGVDTVINACSRFKKDVGYHKAGVESSGEPLDLGNNPARLLPGSGSMLEAAKEPLFFAGFGELFFGLEHQVRGSFAETLIGNQTNCVFDLLALKQSIDARYGKAGIAAHQNGGFRVGTF